MKRQILLCTALALAGITLLVISPSAIAGFSKAKTPTAHMAQPLALVTPDNDESLIQRGFDLLRCLST